MLCIVTNVSSERLWQQLCVVVLKFKSDEGVWKTWIDYPRFHELFQRYLATGETFTALDYARATPEWAVFGSSDRGFDPCETRWRRHATHGC